MSLSETLKKKVEEKSWNFDKNANQLTQKVDGPKKKIGAPYPAQLRTGQNAHNCCKIKCYEILKKISIV